MKKSTLTTFILLAITASSHIFAAEKPDTCPPANSIRTLSFDEGDIVPFIDDIYHTKPITAKLDTKYTWSFTVVTYAANTQAATRKINKDLSEAVFNKGPYLKDGAWQCDYYRPFSNTEMRAALAKPGSSTPL